MIQKYISTYFFINQTKNQIDMATLPSIRKIISKKLEVRFFSGVSEIDWIIIS